MSTRPGTIRSLHSFGVAGMLSADAKVFHEVLFHAGGLGRVSDLIAARMRESEPDEFSVHFLILAGVLGASRVFDSLSPIQLECGMDDEHFAFSFQFEHPGISGILWEGISDRVRSGVVVTPIDELLLSIARNSHHVVVKIDSRAGRIDICSLHRWGRRTEKEAAPLEVVVINGSIEQAPPVADVTALGDLDYTKLLRNPKVRESVEGPASGEVLIHQARDAEDLVHRIRSKKLALEDSGMVRVSGGGTSIASDEVIVVKAQGASGAVDAGEEPPARPKRGFFSKVLKLIARKGSSASKDDHRRGANTQGEAAVGTAAEPQEMLDTPELIPIPEPVEKRVPAMSEIRAAASEIEVAVEEGMNRVSKEVSTLSSEAVQNPRVERWVESLTAELNAERSRIVEISKRLASSVKQKELEFKNRENVLHQHLRERDDIIRAKTSQLMRMKDQLAKAQISLERAKMGASGGDETALKYKYNQSQKLLQMTRGEAESLRFKIEELQGKLLQATEQRKQAVPAAQLGEAQRALDRANRQIEELKRQKAPAAAADEVKKNFEIAQRVALHQKQRSEQLELVVHEQKMEIERLMQELERARGKAGAA